MKPRALAAVGLTGALIAVVLAAMTLVAARAADAPSIQAGHEKFQELCAPCHGTGPGVDGAPVKPAVAALMVKYPHHEESPLLEHRDDLPYLALKAIVRNGTGGMPPLRPSELTDQQIAAVAAYLMDSASKWKESGVSFGAPR